LEIARFGFKKVETSLYHIVQHIFRYLEPFRHHWKARQIETDGQTLS